MNRKDLARLKTWFDEYVSGYTTDDAEYNYPFRLKKNHTRRVCKNIIMIGHALNLSDDELILAETMALFHDMGRFEQYAKYGTFSDIASENHAKLSLRQMATHGVLSKNTKDEKRLITKAIAYHNVAALPDTKDKTELFYMRLLRDADKLDIWKVVIDYYHQRDHFKNSAIELNLPDDPIWSGRVLEAVMNQKIARMEDLKTLNDFKLLQISWVFDLNFAPSFEAVENRHYLYQIEATLPKSPEISDAVAMAHRYVKNNL
ncbi:MAG: HD domain-containing protein [Thermodesulfobacteriota bacterium]|nr:HD domain-containing protein [Thermodesulfobacteriota bacterium]